MFSAACANSSISEI